MIDGRHTHNLNVPITFHLANNHNRSHPLRYYFEVMKGFLPFILYPWVLLLQSLDSLWTFNNPPRKFSTVWVLIKYESIKPCKSTLWLKWKRKSLRSNWDRPSTFDFRLQDTANAIIKTYLIVWSSIIKYTDDILTPRRWNFVTQSNRVWN